MRGVYFLPFTVILIGLFLLPVEVLCQPGDPGGGGVPVPISGIEILLGLGGLYGAKKIYELTKRNK